MKKQMMKQKRKKGGEGEREGGKAEEEEEEEIGTGGRGREKEGGEIYKEILVQTNKQTNRHQAQLPRKPPRGHL